MSTPAALTAGLQHAADLVIAPPDLMGQVAQTVVAFSVFVTPVDTGALRASEQSAVYAPDLGAVQATVAYAQIVYEGTGTNAGKGPRPYFEWGWEAAQPALGALLQAWGDSLWQGVARA